jgi:hypothetical protein
MSKEIVFEPINVEDPAQKNRLQFEAKIFNMVNGKQVYADEETGFIFQKYSGFAPKAFIKEVKGRDFVKISLDPEQESCVKLEKTINEYDDSFEANRKNVFGKYDRLYKFSRSVKKPKSTTEEVISDDEEDVEKETKETKDTQPKFNSCKMKLNMDWFYYYGDERLDKSNTNIVKKAVTDSMNKNKNVDKEKRKALLSTLVFKLNFKDENDKTIQKEVKMDELVQRREINTKVFYRKPSTIPPNAQEFFKKQRGTSAKEIDEYETELVTLFGDPQEPKDVRHPDHLDKYYNYNCWVRFLYSPYRVWASKTKDEDVEIDGKVIPGKRKSGIKYVINSIDIIQLPFENNFSSSHKTVYAKYAFGKRGNDELLINQSVDTVFTAVEKSSQSVQSVQSTESTSKPSKSDKTDKTDKTDKKEKIQMKVESDSEESGEESEESEESDAEESENEDKSESESESEPEPEPEPVKKGKGKTVVETAKNTKSKDTKKKNN